MSLATHLQEQKSKILMEESKKVETNTELITQIKELREDLKKKDLKMESVLLEMAEMKKQQKDLHGRMLKLDQKIENNVPLISYINALLTTILFLFFVYSYFSYFRYIKNINDALYQLLHQAGLI